MLRAGKTMQAYHGGNPCTVLVVHNGDLYGQGNDDSVWYRERWEWQEGDCVPGCRHKNSYRVIADARVGAVSLFPKRDDFAECIECGHVWNVALSMEQRRLAFADGGPVYICPSCGDRTEFHR